MGAPCADHCVINHDRRTNAIPNPRNTDTSDDFCVRSVQNVMLFRDAVICLLPQWSLPPTFSSCSEMTSTFSDDARQTRSTQQRISNVTVLTILASDEYKCLHPIEPLALSDDERRTRLEQQAVWDVAVLSILGSDTYKDRYPIESRHLSETVVPANMPLVSTSFQTADVS